VGGGETIKTAESPKRPSTPCCVRPGEKTNVKTLEKPKGGVNTQEEGVSGEAIPV